MEPSQEKKTYREELKLKLKSVEERSTRSQKLLDALLKGNYLSDVSLVSVFISLPDEVDTMPIVEYCWNHDIRVGVPEFHHTPLGGQIDIREWNEHDELMVVHHGIAHPRSGRLFRVPDVDLLLVPGLAFTNDGLRLGRGMGFYDRYLSQFTGTSIGLCFKEQLQNKVPVEGHDKSVDVVLSC